MSEKLHKFRLNDEDSSFLNGDGEKKMSKKERRAAEEARREFGSAASIESVLPIEPVAEEHPQEPVVEEVVPEVAPQEEKLPEDSKVSELAEIYGDKTPPASVEELFNKLKGKKREEYVTMLRSRMAEEAQKKSARSQRPQKKDKSEPNGFSPKEIDAIAQETLDQINDFKSGVDVSEKYAPQYGQGEPAHLDDEPITEPMPSVFRSGRREAGPEADLPVLTEVVPEVVEEEFKNEATAKENREKFLDVMARAKEKLGGKNPEEYLISRSQELYAEAAKIGKVEKLFRSLGENYNKLGWKSKLAVGAGLGIGAGVSASFMFPTALAVCVTGIIGQRAAGLATMYLKFEKGKQDEKWGKEKAMGKAIAYTAGMTGAMILLSEGVREGIDYASQHGWLSNMLGHQQNPSASGKINYPASVHPVAAGEAAVAMPSPEMPTVSAAHGHGYEYMMKQLWHQLHEGNIKPPPGANPDSDFAQLMNAKPDEIDAIVHRIASDPHHAFFNTDGTSVRIDAGAHMTIGTDGQLHLGIGNAVHHMDVVQATPEMQVHVTPSLHTEVPAVETLPQYEIPPQPEIQTVDLTTPDTGGAMSHEPVPESVETHSNAPIIDHSSVLNIFGMDVPVAEAHIYTDPGGKHLFVYGGSPKEKMDMITTFLNRNPDKVIFSSDATGANRVPWHVVGKEIVPDAPMKTGIIFKTFMKAPNPNEFQKVIL